VQVISFDIDGTLEVGDPPGQISLGYVLSAIEKGYIVGSCSDRPLSYQKALWKQHSIDMKFTVLKQNLHEVRLKFPKNEYVHIGDTEVDQMMAKGADFDFVHSIDDDVLSYLNTLGLTASLTD
jgi:hydroxymethylpyrimidine pyrophosphatase-like HAD family hydrolase|tara:strand:- start:734 stop:1102 length:369 start_codon:yes stop_codon:yes gene_type:complete